jgi:hypothetical protein
LGTELFFLTKNYAFYKYTQKKQAVNAILCQKFMILCLSKKYSALRLGAIIAKILSGCILKK